MTIHPEEDNCLVASVGQNEARALMATLGFGARRANPESERHVHELHNDMVKLLQHLADNGGGFLIAEPKDG